MRAFLAERYDRRALIIGVPPFACDHVGALGLGRGESETDIAPHQPLAGRGDFRFAHRDAVDRGDAPAQHRHLLDIAGAVDRFDQIGKAVGLVALDIDEEEGRRFLRDLFGDQASANCLRSTRLRPTPPGRCRATGRCSASPRRSRPRLVSANLRLPRCPCARAAHQPHQQPAGKPEHHHADHRAADEPHADPTVASGEDREARRTVIANNAVASR